MHAFTRIETFGLTFPSIKKRDPYCNTLNIKKSDLSPT